MRRWGTLDIFTEDSKKHQHTVNWDETNQTEKWKTEEHELMIDSGCFGHVCPPWFAPPFPMVSSTNVEAVAANNVAAKLRTESGSRKCDDEQWWTNFDPDHI